MLSLLSGVLAVGAALAPFTAAATVAPSPTAQNQRYVRTLYLDALQRPVDPLGFQTRVGALDVGVLRRVVARQVIFSPEYRATWVKEQYLHLLKRNGDPQGVDYYAAYLDTKIGRDQGVIAALASSPEYFQKAGMTNVGFVSQLYIDLLGRQADPGGLNFFLGLLGRNPSRERIIHDLERSVEYQTKVVQDAYLIYLDRAADPGGLAFSLQVLARRGGRHEDLSLVLASSDEYFMVAVKGGRS